MADHSRDQRSSLTTQVNLEHTTIQIEEGSHACPRLCPYRPINLNNFRLIDLPHIFAVITRRRHVTL